MGKAEHVRHPARLESLPLITRFVEDACGRSGAGEEITYALRLAVEEVCTNVINYGYAGMAPGFIALHFAAQPDRWVLEITDWGRPFDPRSAPPPDLTSSAEDRPIGGLGLYLVSKMTDEMSYRPDPERGNVLTLVMHRRGTES